MATPKAVLAERARWIRMLCPNCRPGHLLEDGRVWGMCGTQFAIHKQAFTDEELAEVIRTLPEPKRENR